MEQDTEITQVIFRNFEDGEVIALFPEIEADYSGNIQSYLHVGQHGAACPSLVTDLQPSMPWEYADLQIELESVIGYNLEVMEA